MTNWRGGCISFRDFYKSTISEISSMSHLFQNKFNLQNFAAIYAVINYIHPFKFFQKSNLSFLSHNRYLFFNYIYFFDRKILKLIMRALSFRTHWTYRKPRDPGCRDVDAPEWCSCIWNRPVAVHRGQKCSRESLWSATFSSSGTLRQNKIARSISHVSDKKYDLAEMQGVSTVDIIDRSPVR